MDLEETELAVIVETEDDPAPIGRVGTNKRADISTLVLRHQTQLCSVRVNRCDVCRYPRDEDVSILAKHKAFAVRRPVLFGSNIEFKRSDLDHIAAIEVRSKQGGSDRLSVLGDKAEFLAAGRNVRIETTRANDSLPDQSGRRQCVIRRA